VQEQEPRFRVSAVLVEQEELEELYMSAGLWDTRQELFRIIHTQKQRSW
jgi:hypothetical protein